MTKHKRIKPESGAHVFAPYLARHAQEWMVKKSFWQGRPAALEEARLQLRNAVDVLDRALEAKRLARLARARAARKRARKAA